MAVLTLIGCTPGDLLPRLLGLPDASPLTVDEAMALTSALRGLPDVNDEHLDKQWQDMIVSLMVFAMRWTGCDSVDCVDCASCEISELTVCFVITVLHYSPTTAKRSLALLRLATRLLKDASIFDCISISCNEVYKRSTGGILISKRCVMGLTCKSSLVACMVRLASKQLVTSAGADPRLQLLKQRVDSQRQEFRKALKEGLRASSVIEHIARCVAGLPRAAGTIYTFAGAYSTALRLLSIIGGDIESELNTGPCARYLRLQAGMATLTVADGGSSYGFDPAEVAQVPVAERKALALMNLMSVEDLPLRVIGRIAKLLLDRDNFADSRDLFEAGEPLLLELRRRVAQGRGDLAEVAWRLATVVVPRGMQVPDVSLGELADLILFEYSDAAGLKAAVGGGLVNLWLSLLQSVSSDQASPRAIDLLIRMLERAGPCFWSLILGAAPDVLDASTEIVHDLLTTDVLHILFDFLNPEVGSSQQRAALQKAVCELVTAGPSLVITAWVAIHRPELLLLVDDAGDGSGVAFPDGLWPMQIQGSGSGQGSA